MYAYCYFCQTAHCKAIAVQMEQQGAVRAFTPRIIRRQRIQGVNIDKMYDLLPGYVFAFMEEEPHPSGPFRNINGIVRRIGNAGDRWRLTGSDYEFAMNLFRKDGVVGQVTLIRTGDQVRIDDPLFNRASGTVTKVDYRKGRARVEYQFDGMQCFAWVAFEMLNLNQL